MIVIGVGNFVHNMGMSISGAIRQSQKILITRDERPYFIVTPFQELDEDGRIEVREALRISKKRKLLVKARWARMKKNRT